MSEGSSRSRWWIVLLCGVGLAIAAWLVLDPSGGEPGADRPVAGKPGGSSLDKRPATTNSPLEKSREAADGPQNEREPDYRMPASGRLTIEASSLPEKGALVLGLAMVEEDGGVEPLAVRIASVDGRVFDTTAVRQHSTAPDVRIPIDTDWLQPGQYMVQIKTAGTGPLPLRRYVLEVR